jgi:hypothetical protein
MKYLSEQEEQYVMEDYQGPPASEPPVRSSEIVRCGVCRGRSYWKDGLGNNLCDKCAVATVAHAFGWTSWPLLKRMILGYIRGLAPNDRTERRGTATPEPPKTL